MRKILAFITVASICTGCQFDPYADRYTVVKPSDSDVVGTYEFEYQTLDTTLNDEKIRKGKPRIIIRSNRTFVIKELPYFKDIGTMNYKFEKQISVSGTWTIDGIGTVDFGNGDKKTHWGLILKSAPDELTNAGLMGTEKPNGIIFGYGDPDSGDVMVLNKK